MRSTAPARIRFFGDVSLGKRFVSEGRTYLGILENDMRLGGTMSGTRRIRNPQGVVFKVARSGSEVSIDIDVRSVRMGTITRVFRGLVVRPSNTDSFGIYGYGSQIVLSKLADPDNPEDSILRPRWYAADFREGMTTTPTPERYYERTYDEGLQYAANMDWRSDDEAWVLYMFGPDNRYFGQFIPAWAGDIVYTKGQPLFQMTDLIGTPLGDAHPALTDFDTWLTGAAVMRTEEATYLIVAASTVPGTIFVSAMTDYFIAVPIDPVWPADTDPPRDKPEYAPRYQARPEDAVLLAQHEYDGSDDTTVMRAVEHPWHFNGDATEARTLRQIINDDGGVAPVDDFIAMREVVFHLPALDEASVAQSDHVRRVLRIDRSDTVIEGRPDYEVLPIREDGFGGDVLQARNISDDYVDDAACINRGSQVQYFVEDATQVLAIEAQDDALVPMAVDYQAGTPKYAYLPSATGAGTSTVVATSTPTVNDLGTHSYRGLTSHTTRTCTSSLTRLVAGITTDFYTLECEDTESTTLGEDLTFTIAYSGAYHLNERNGTTERETDVLAHDLHVLFLDLRHEWLVFYVKAETINIVAESVYAGVDENAPTSETTTTTTVTHRFGVVRGDTLAYESEFSETPAVDVDASASIEGNGLFTLGASLSRLAQPSVLYTIPGTDDLTRPSGEGDTCDEAVPANPGSGPVTWVDDSTTTSAEPSRAALPAKFLDKDDPDFGWMQAQLAPSSDAEYPYIDAAGLKTVGSWVSFEEEWMFSMPWPEALNTPNFLTVSSVPPTVSDATGNPEYGERFYPIWVLPATQLLD